MRAVSALILWMFFGVAWAHPDHSSTYSTIEEVHGPQPLILREDVTETVVAGYTGSQAELPQYTHPGERFQAIRAFALEEQSDEPCRVEAVSIPVRSPWSLETVPTIQGPAMPYTIAHGFWRGENCDQTIEGVEDDYPLAFFQDAGELFIDLGAHMSLYKLQVCTNDRRSDDRKYLVKGVRMWGRRVTEDGVIITEGTSFSDEQPNCRDNYGDTGTAECPAGHVAASMVLHHRSIGNRDALTGISLKCRALRAHPLEPRPDRINLADLNFDRTGAKGTSTAEEDRPGPVGSIGSGRPGAGGSTVADETPSREDSQSFEPLLPGSGDDARPSRGDGLVRPTFGPDDEGVALTRPPEPNGVFVAQGAWHRTGVAGFAADPESWPDSQDITILEPFCTDHFPTSAEIDQFGGWPDWASSGCALRYLHIGERSDEPCRVETRSEAVGYEDGRAIVRESNSGTDYLNEDDCDVFGDDNSIISMSLPYRTYLSSVSVCSSSAGSWRRSRLVKGIRGTGRRISGNNEVTDVDGAVYTDEQPNCDDDWAELGTAACPAGWLAGRVLVHRQEIGGRRAIIGLQLDCLEVVFD